MIAPLSEARWAAGPRSSPAAGPLRVSQRPSPRVADPPMLLASSAASSSHARRSILCGCRRCAAVGASRGLSDSLGCRHGFAEAVCGACRLLPPGPWFRRSSDSRAAAQRQRMMRCMTSCPDPPPLPVLCKRCQGIGVQGVKGRTCTGTIRNTRAASGSAAAGGQRRVSARLRTAAPCRTPAARTRRAGRRRGRPRARVAPGRS